MRIVFSEWKSVGKVKLPYVVTATDQAGNQGFRFSEIKVNTVDERIFAVAQEILNKRRVVS